MSQQQIAVADAVVGLPDVHPKILDLSWPAVGKYSADLSLVERYLSSTVVKQLGPAEKL